MKENGGVNAHTHLYSGLVTLGMPAPDPAPRAFPEILERVWWRLDRALDADSLRAAAELYVTEAIESGTTGLIDHHESPSFVEGSLDLLAEVCQVRGMPAVLCYGVTERNDGRDEAKRGLEECRYFLESNRRSLVAGAVGVHAGFTVSDETLREAAELARELGAVLHLHVAEDACDVEDARRRGYGGIVDRLEALGVLVRGSILAHGVHLTEGEVRRVAEAGCWLVQNPRSNVGNGVGYARNLAASELVALGTDGYPSDLRAEEACLFAEASAAGEELEVVARRLPAGEELLGSWFDGDLPNSARRARERAVEELPELRRRAQEQAERLWKRMAEL